MTENLSHQALIDPLITGSPKRGSGLSRLLWYCIANLGFGTFYAVNNAALPLWLQHYTRNAIILSLMAGTHACEGIIIQPIVGAVSDRLRTRMGRRRPFLLVAVPISAILFLIAPYAAHLPPHYRLIAICACILISTTAFNVAQDPYQALLSDIAKPDERGRASGLSQALLLIGQAIILIAPLPVTQRIQAVGLIMLVTTGLTCWKTPEAPHLEMQRRVSAWQTIGHALRSLGTLKQTRLYLIAFVFYGIGTAAIVPNMTMFIQYITHCSDALAQNLFLVLVVSALAFSLPSGFLTDRIGEKPMLIAGIVCILVAAVWGLFLKTIPEIEGVLVLAGLGTAMQNSSAYPMLIRLVPHSEIGVFTGLASAADALVMPGTLAWVGWLINRSHHGYRIIFDVCVLGTLAAAACIALISSRKADHEIGAAIEQNRALGFEGATE